jgi:hypothetical protein
LAFPLLLKQARIFGERNLLLKPIKQQLMVLLLASTHLSKLSTGMALISKIQDTIKRIFGPLLEPESGKKVDGTEYHVILLHSMYKQGRPTDQRERHVRE